MKTLDEINKEYDELCDKQQSCDFCPLKRLDQSVDEGTGCSGRFVYEAMMQEIQRLESELEKRGTNNESSADTNLPTSAKRSVGEDINGPAILHAWCKIGKLAMDKDGVIWRIIDIYRDNVMVVIRNPQNGEVAVEQIKNIKPVRFRPYTYVEAKGLLGKTMEYRDKTECSFVCNSMLISRVSFNPDSSEVFIHSCRFSDWWDNEATIDGIPIGVPEVDEEAMKE